MPRQQENSNPVIHIFECARVEKRERSDRPKGVDCLRGRCTHSEALVTVPAVSRPIELNLTVSNAQGTGLTLIDNTPQQTFLLVQIKIPSNLLNYLVQFLLSLSHNSHLLLPRSPPPLHWALPSLWPNASPAVPKLSPWKARATTPCGAAVRSNVAFCHLRPRMLRAVFLLTNQGRSQASDVLMSESGISSASASSSALLRNPSSIGGRLPPIEVKSIRTANSLTYLLRFIWKDLSFCIGSLQRHSHSGPEKFGRECRLVRSINPR